MARKQAACEAALSDDAQVQASGKTMPVFDVREQAACEMTSAADALREQAGGICSFTDVQEAAPAADMQVPESGAALEPAGDRVAAGAVAQGASRTAAVFFVGNKLMLDEGVGPAAYEGLLERYDVPGNVLLFDVGCMSMDMLPYVRDCDVILTVDAVDGTGEEPGTVFRFPPDAMARAAGARASLHDLKLADLFDAATLLGYEAEGYCLGMQVENMSPAEYVVGLTPKVHAALPLLVETVAAELARRGFPLAPKEGAACNGASSDA